MAETTFKPSPFEPALADLIQTFLQNDRYLVLSPDTYAQFGYQDINPHGRQVIYNHRPPEYEDCLPATQCKAGIFAPVGCLVMHIFNIHKQAVLLTFQAVA